MPVTDAYRAYVLEQLGRVAPVSARSMFGGVGIYSGGLFFALLDDDTLYLKVDETTRGRFEAAGTGPFRPFGPEQKPMRYYELPADRLEDADRLRPWVEDALAVAARSRRRKP